MVELYQLLRGKYDRLQTAIGNFPISGQSLLTNRFNVKTMEFKMERPGLLKEGYHVTVTEGKLPSNYYYTIDPSLAMSGNFPFRERLLAREGDVQSIVENERGFYVTVAFDEPEGKR